VHVRACVKEAFRASCHMNLLTRRRIMWRCNVSKSVPVVVFFALRREERTPKLSKSVPVFVFFALRREERTPKLSKSAPVVVFFALRREGRTSKLLHLCHQVRDLCLALPKCYIYFYFLELAMSVCFFWCFSHRCAVPHWWSHYAASWTLASSRPCEVIAFYQLT
jgi:hypothetical protein